MVNYAELLLQGSGSTWSQNHNSHFDKQKRPTADLSCCPCTEPPPEPRCCKNGNAVYKQLHELTRSDTTQERKDEIIAKLSAKFGASWAALDTHAKSVLNLVELGDFARWLLNSSVTGPISIPNEDPIDLRVVYPCCCFPQPPAPEPQEPLPQWANDHIQRSLHWDYQ